MNHKVSRAVSPFLCLWIAWSHCDAASSGVARTLSNEIADTVEKVMPSVVVLRTEAVRYSVTRDWFFGDLYRIPERLAGHGSGVIITANGYVLTSAHVVKDSDNIEVVLHDGRKFAAELKGLDSSTDLAVVKIITPDRETFKPIVIGDSDKLRVGEIVIALGSPFSLNSSVTMGIVSQKGRNVGLLPYEDFIQTDASINPGNSGGPLVDVDGRMIGVNAMIHTGGRISQGNIGIGFAVPANLADRVARSLIGKGRFDRPWIGISSLALNIEDLRQKTKLETGLLVVKVIEDAPAGKAGLRKGDVLYKINGVPLIGVNQLQKAIMQCEVGENVSISVYRDGRLDTFQVKTESMPPLDSLDLRW